MNGSRTPHFLPGALLACVLLVATTAHAGGLRRFAVVAGNDEGGPDTRPLFYAREDARKIADILNRLGGVHASDAELILNGTADQLLSALARIEQKSAEAKGRGETTVLYFYYSGHAKDGALRLGRTRLPFEALKNRLAQSPADVRIGIFDACRSGALARRKGVRKAPAFEIQSDASTGARGLVILTSSAADEDSQESDLVGGSYFSHHLASGLLGDADQSGDGRVTLAEAYAYAYERTLAATAETVAGAQHPAFAYELSGNGDWVMTEPFRRSEGALVPAPAPSGTYYFVNRDGRIAAEVVKREGEPRRLALAPGSYKVKRRLEDRLRIGELFVGAGRIVEVNESSFRDAPFSADPVKGAPQMFVMPEPRWSLWLGGAYQTFFEAEARRELFPSTPLLNAEAQLRDFFRAGWTVGIDAAIGETRGMLTLDTLSTPYRYQQVSVGGALIRELDLGIVNPFVGVRVAMMWMRRDLQLFARTQHYSMMTPGVVVGARAHLFGAWSVAVRGRTHYLLYNVDEQRSLGYAELAALLMLEL